MLKIKKHKQSQTTTISGQQQKRRHMLSVMQSTFQQLQTQRIRQDLNTMFQLQQLQIVNQKMQDNNFLGVVGYLNLQSQTAITEKQNHLQSLLKRLQQYIDVLAINQQYDDSNDVMTDDNNQNNKKKKKLQLHPFSKINQLYFSQFHDLQILDQQPIQTTDKQDIQHCVNQLRQAIFDCPKRQQQEIDQDMIEQMIGDIDNIVFDQTNFDLPNDFENQQIINQFLESQNQQQSKIQPQQQQGEEVEEEEEIKQQPISESNQQQSSTQGTQQQSSQTYLPSSTFANKQSSQRNQSQQQKQYQNTTQKHQQKQQQTTHKYKKKQKSLILQHLSVLEEQLSQSLSQSLQLLSISDYSNNNPYLQMILDQLKQDELFNKLEYQPVENITNHQQQQQQRQAEQPKHTTRQQQQKPTTN